MNKATSIFAPLVIACAMAAFTAHPTTAQTAGNLKCKGCVNSKDIKNKSIRANDIRNNTVTGAKVRNGSLSAIDLGDEAGVEFVGGDQSLVLDLSTDTVVRSVTVTAPGNGFVILNASGEFGMTANALVRCSLTTELILENDDFQSAGLINDGHFQFFGMTEVFVVAAGSATFNLVCREVADSVNIHDTDLTAIYVPTRY